MSAAYSTRDKGRQRVNVFVRRGLRVVTVITIMTPASKTEQKNQRGEVIRSARAPRSPRALLAKNRREVVDRRESWPGSEFLYARTGDVYVGKTWADCKKASPWRSATPHLPARCAQGTISLTYFDATENHLTNHAINILVPAYDRLPHSCVPIALADRALRDALARAANCFAPANGFYPSLDSGSGADPRAPARS